MLDKEAREAIHERFCSDIRLEVVRVIEDTMEEKKVRMITEHDADYLESLEATIQKAVDLFRKVTYCSSVISLELLYDIEAYITENSPNDDIPF